MAITSSTPLIFEGKEYPFYAINLSISPLWQPTNIGGSVAMRLTPYREKTVEEGGGFETVSEQAKQVVFLDVFTEAQNDVDVANVANSIMAALQQYITNKAI